MRVHAARLLVPAPPTHRRHAVLRFTVSAAAISVNVTPADTARKQAVIVGGGLAGLAAATHLASLSVPFTLLEASDRLGGRVATDEVDGYLLDRGFQIFLTAYPECQRLLDYPALRLQPFFPGALVYLGGDSPSFHMLSDPFRFPIRSLSSVFSPVGSLPDKLLVGLARLRAAATPDDVILSSPETTTARHLEKLGFSSSIVERFLRPFLAGIFFDPALDTSSRLFELVFKRLALGDNALPEAGIGAIAAQLADRLPAGSVRLNARASTVDSSSGVTLDTGETVSGELGVIVAVEQPEAEKLLPQLPTRSNNKKADAERSTVCIYFSADRAAVQEPVLLLNGSGKGIVNNMFFATNVAPSYAPAGKVLVSVSLVGSFTGREDAELAGEVVRELGGWFGAEEVSSWAHLRTYRIGFAQPDQTPPTAPAGRDPRVGDGLYVCGDHWCSATFDGAMVSGRRAAEALAQDKGLSVNRRLDEWVKLEQLDLDTVEADVDEKIDDKATSLKMTRHQKRKIDETHVEQGHEELDAASLREHEEFTKVKNIAKIELGKYEIDTWYFSPFPPEYNDSAKLFFCEFCLNFMKRKEQLQRHMKKCDLKHPPGDEIYRCGTLSMFEVDGKKNKIYGQNLCYLAKLFLDHKTLYYDVDLFLFYILCECDDRGCHMVGYFSKEKHSEESYNLACILTLPPYQRKGYGKFLIAFSYELSKKEGKVGTPERPLSDLGLVSYRGYWTRVLLEILKKHKSNISIKELSDMTAIKADDILSTLQSLDLIQYRKGQHVICADPKVLDRHLKAAGRGGLDVDVTKLIWTPYKEQG